MCARLVDLTSCRMSSRAFLTLWIAGHFYFTELLIPALYKASTPERKSRVVNLTSQMGLLGISAFGSGLDFSTFKDSPTKRKMSEITSYNQAKLVSSPKSSQFRSNSPNYGCVGKRCLCSGVRPTVWRQDPLLPRSPRFDFYVKSDLVCVHQLPHLLGPVVSELTRTVATPDSA